MDDRWNTRNVCHSQGDFEVYMGFKEVSLMFPKVKEFHLILLNVKL